MFALIYVNMELMLLDCNLNHYHILYRVKKEKLPKRLDKSFTGLISNAFHLVFREDPTLFLAIFVDFSNASLPKYIQLFEFLDC